MKKLILACLISFGFMSCKDVINEPLDYLNKVSYDLNKASDYEYSGVLEVGELPNGELELEIKLYGATGNQSVTFPTHLHFGSYDTPDAEMAAMLNPINANTLTSRTILPQLADGTKLTFEDFKSFDGHIKVHLASEGPDYQVILVAGNVGSNVDLSQGFNPDKITMCSDTY
ncbi:hypothetical protein FHS59_003633 [Algoriphagus iocasae]|uniref:CHRD domain-containing protein n=1 Tax=Algoriphagus iocasae TaxID=1836499 RepID=A0A841MKM4_9BACT|nr:hypothetical protein [Algoriphagus iocasae]MBB6327990.1 hypothetical protein [Algoriphagus iocasae]